MTRREFTKSAISTAAVGFTGALSAEAASAGAGDAAPFKLKYAPNFRQFRHHAGEDPVEVIRFMHAQGFRAIEDNGMMRRPVEEQARIGAELERLGMTMGVFVVYADFRNPTFASHGTYDEQGRLQRDREGVRRMLVERFNEAVEAYNKRLSGFPGSAAAPFFKMKKYSLLPMPILPDEGNDGSDSAPESGSEAAEEASPDEASPEPAAQ